MLDIQKCDMINSDDTNKEDHDAPPDPQSFVIKLLENEAISPFDINLIRGILDPPHTAQQLDS